MSIDDSEVIALAQDGFRQAADAGRGIVEMGGRDSADAEHMVTEVAIRAFYAATAR